LGKWRESADGRLLVIRLTIFMPRWIWWLALRFHLGIALEVDGERVPAIDVVSHGGPLTLIYRTPPGALAFRSEPLAGGRSQPAVVPGVLHTLTSSPTQDQVCELRQRPIPDLESPEQVSSAGP
jgi:hypothetical protein